VRQLWANDDGVAGIEMAIITPVLLILLCGGGEICLYARSHFQASQMASTVADAVSRYKAITSSDITSIFTVSSEIMGTADFQENGSVILTSVSRTGGATPTVAWQCKGGPIRAQARSARSRRQQRYLATYLLTRRTMSSLRKFLPIFPAVRRLSPCRKAALQNCRFPSPPW
jgi:Flp pilus assembly protein TadG